ncbi:TRAP transporter small permease [Alkalilimnicola ehrlichii]|nr:TRAP transporter small permease [Alkalilimnicola ehrlichii]
MRLINFLIKTLAVLDRGLERCEAILLSGAVLAMAVLNVANVIGRNLGHSLPFTGELNRLLIVLITFMGVGYAARKARHIRMSALAEQFHGISAKILHITIHLGTAVLLFALAWFALDYVQQTRQIGSVTASLHIPLYLIYLAIPIGLCLGGIQFLLAAIRNIATPGVYLAFNVPDTQDDDHHNGRI